MKKLTLFLLFVSSFVFGQQDPLFKPDSTKIDTVLINSYSKKTSSKNEGFQRNVWAVGNAIKTITEIEKQLLFEYLKEEIKQKAQEYNTDAFYGNHQNMYFKINDLEQLRKQNFKHNNLPLTQFVETKAKFRGDNLQLSGSIGVGMIRDRISPMLDLAAGANFWDNKKNQYWTGVKVGWQPYFSFERNTDGNYAVNRNDFLYLSLGRSYDSRLNKENDDWRKNWRVGIGYLVRQEGNYFQGNTYKLFFQTRTKGRISIMPELIFTNNFKQIFPSLTIQF